MKIWPLRFRGGAADGYLFTDDAGGFFRADATFLDRYVSGGLTARDKAFLHLGGHGFEEAGDLAHTSFAYRWSQRQAIRTELGYVILVPTLRCNLTCTYCQVSRAAENARGYDWSEDTTEAVLRYLDGLTTSDVKIEFQGGEPLLRLDLLEEVRSFCRRRFTSSKFVVCTNLQRLGSEEWSFLDAPDTFVSTSLDGDLATHTRQRTRSTSATEGFLSNLDQVLERLGADKVSALPTIDIDDPPDFDELIEAYSSRGMRSIYLRPINHQGFARRARSVDADIERWNMLHREFVEHLVDLNYRTGAGLEEYYFSQCLRRALRPGADDHVDLRNPNFFGSDYVVIDHDGKLYPTDEARMLSRIGRIDLSIGDVFTGIAAEKRDILNAASLNSFDPDCIHCAFQPYCGSDLIDDLSRYGRSDHARSNTWFCRRHTSVFDHVFELMYRGDAAADHSLAQWSGIANWGAHLAPKLS
ncbi:His-Xaa-Ser system radical SAM maturase HxsB [Bosea sp. CS1GBMeth4]|uniref:His-Xaa-Ser system radical SAM maturase HxsB n=1 Tax=Bosea sp. CS1GBMeth4 TaxID=1892849 RepID=UPI00164681C4|nr:His-Xaa-Ser system radical SAM maturase HxsB [Bosea sp. CS1GBMeth4]